MNFLEKDLEDIIFETKNEILFERGLESILLGGIDIRQLRIGNYGIADIVQWRKYYEHYSEEYPFLRRLVIEFNIIELKKDEINSDTFFQALSYLKGITSLIDDYFSDGVYEYKLLKTITLIGRKVNLSSSFCYLTDFLDDSEFLELCFYEYTYGIDGLFFKKSTGYDLTDKGIDSLRDLKYKYSVKTIL